ncbi:MAG: hypothetical protein LBV71_11180 [Prevotella sp.]|jgi:hypothetical protein|nr:hypothetical protein [Prevotella sp.]
MTLVIDTENRNTIKLEIKDWKSKIYSWKVLSQGNYVFKLTRLQFPKRYNISVNNKQYPAQVEKDGTLTIKT